MCFRFKISCIIFIGIDSGFSNGDLQTRKVRGFDEYIVECRINAYMFIKVQSIYTVFNM